ncbi:MAG: type II toxin-antitoxin system RelB/DinJ family antitoxin [Fusobacteriaceae bacterium]|jgi:DNA-damage-inducible protein J|nr:type II toxin-antitoxin system RelB/DinJ family antitoxin [Fusobacteriaceae bacterium]
MAQTTISVRMDEEVKNALEEFCSDVGLNISVAINLFAKTVIREQRLPFEISSRKKDPFYSVENQKRLLEAKQRMEKTGGTIHELIESSDD